MSKDELLFQKMANNSRVDDYDDGMDSADEALCEMLGLLTLPEQTSIHEEESESEFTNSPNFLPNLHNPMSDQDLIDLRNVYTSESICVLPSRYSICPTLMRRITDELVYGSQKYSSDKTYETIQDPKGAGPRRELTRLENFVVTHEIWCQLAYEKEVGCQDGYLPILLSAIMGERMTLYKEKLNLKPRGGSGFAPHLDTPSLRTALGSQGPQTFCTVMVAIDDMTIRNGCLKVCKGSWSEKNHKTVIEPDHEGNPDAGGRAGAIPLDVANALNFEPIVCRAGTIVVFNGWAPHRSSLNQSAFSRRAVFFTYNPEKEGFVRETYYESMARKREEWRQKQKLKLNDHVGEMTALASVPK